MGTPGIKRCLDHPIAEITIGCPVAHSAYAISKNTWYVHKKQNINKLAYVYPHNNKLLTSVLTGMYTKNTPPMVTSAINNQGELIQVS